MQAACEAASGRTTWSGDPKDRRFDLGPWERSSHEVQICARDPLILWFGAPSLNGNTDKAISQCDVACFQVSQH